MAINVDKVLVKVQKTEIIGDYLYMMKAHIFIYSKS